MKKPSVILLKTKKNKILMGRRNDSKKWTFIGGGFEKGENAQECVIRETFEEVGIKLKSKDIKQIDRIIDHKKDIHIFKATIKKNVKIDFSKDPDKEFYKVKFFKLDDVLHKIPLHFNRKDNALIKHFHFNDTIMDSLNDNS